MRYHISHGEKHFEMSDKNAKLEHVSDEALKEMVMIKNRIDQLDTSKESKKIL